ncbi:Putative Finger protein [Aspergillus calidoustus]|uniref:Putative Finger protein n=1 Tax=Aspergillus calidoustus TaxID=454130 RepID=A0A0U5FY54_ASPCI|nr:Putative Finger protein [Aspergillus calidoustus]
MPIAKTEKETVKLFQFPKVVFSVPLQTLAVMEPISPDGNPTTPDPSEAWSRRSGRIRVTRACDRCKKRKVRCTGQRPCHVCIEASTTCSYNASYTRGRQPAVRVTDLGPPARLAAGPRALQDKSQRTIRCPPNSTATDPASHDALLQGNLLPNSEPVSRTSPEPAEADLEGHYVGPSSGLSFLARVQKRFQQSVALPRGISVFNFGDSSLPYDDACSLTGETAPIIPDLTFAMLLHREDTAALVRRYFDFAVPVDRFLHRPTIEQWFDEFYETRGVMRERDAAPAQTAVLFMIFAIAQEHTVPKLSPIEANTSGRYFRAANQQLSKESGPVRLASIQARLCQCLWLLSQSRINHCWSLFGTVSRLIFALGLHRYRQASSSTMTQVEIECRRRTFWSAYSLDNYLSTALGRPRTFNDKDIDQQFPSCVDDQDIPKSTDSLTLPADRGLSTMFGPVSYAKLSQILSGVLSDIYSIKAMSMTERFSLTAKYMNQVRAWRAELSDFLGQSSSNAAPLVLIYQRQQNILNLAYWHTVILINRPLLLANFARLTNRTSTTQRQDQERQVHVAESVDECLNAGMEIVRVVDRMIQANQLFRAFWFTPYFAFSASVILYVYTIQHSNEPNETYTTYFTAAERCQRQIFDTSEPGSLTARYCLVLEELRSEALRQIATVQFPENQPTPIHHSLNTMSAEVEGLSSSTQDIGDGFPNSIPDLEAMGNLGDFHLSPSDSLQDLTSWGQFDSMAISGFNGLYNL